MKIRAGIFFGGPSREREVSFAGGRAVFENLDRAVFNPVPVFVDSARRFILLDWTHLYQASIRDFYPSPDLLPDSPYSFRVYIESLNELDEAKRDQLLRAAGRPVEAEDLPDHIDLAFLTLHGAYGEDGQIQRELEALGIPYTGSGLRTSLVGTDKVLQKEWMAEHGLDSPDHLVIDRRGWTGGQIGPLFDRAVDRIGFPMVIRPANQGSGIGLSIIEHPCGPADFEEAVNRAFFRELIPVERWRNAGEYERIDHLRLLTDPRDGLGFPLRARLNSEEAIIHHPAGLLQWLDQRTVTAETGEVLVLESCQEEAQVIIESFVHGRSFSSIVLRREDGAAVALPPTELIEGEGFDPESTTRQLTPMVASAAELDAIRTECERLFSELGLRAYARIDGFLTAGGRVFLDDANTNPGFSASALLYQQGAAIGLAPTRLLTYLIRVSLQERVTENPDRDGYQSLLQQLDRLTDARRHPDPPLQRIALILGGSPDGRPHTVANGQYVFRQLAASGKYDPIPVWLSGPPDRFGLQVLPLDQFLAGPEAGPATREEHPAVAVIRDRCAPITRRYGTGAAVFDPQTITAEELGEQFDGAFITLPGHGPENGPLQRQLKAINLPFTGSEAVTAALATHRYRTLQTLRTNGLATPDQLLMKKENYEKDPDSFFERIESRLPYPLIARPADNGRPSAVRTLASREELEAYTRLLFRPEGENATEARKRLRLREQDPFPRKEEVLFEERMSAARAVPVTGGLITGIAPDGRTTYEVFEPTGLTDKDVRRRVKEDLEKAARILNLQGFATLDTLVRLYDHRPPETVFLAVHALPDLTPPGALFQQAVKGGYQPHQLIDKIQTFAFAKAGQLLFSTPETEEENPAFKEKSPVRYAGPPGMEKKEDTAMESSEKSSPAQNRKETALRYLREAGKFLSSPVFLLNFAGILGTLVVLLLLVTWVLSLYTHHGESLQVHNYVGMQLDEAREKARSRSFSVVVSDSIFILDEPPNKVLEQDPKPFSRVKENRRIYLVITKSTPDLISLPDLVGNYDYDQYTRKLKRLNIRFRIRDRVFDSRLEENTILYFYHNDRKITDADLRKGVKVPMGSVLEFVVTERNTGMVNIPELVCKRYDAAVFLINSMNLGVGNVYGGGGDNSSAYVWKQDPAYSPGQMIPMGRQIDIYLTSVRPEECPPELNPRDLEDSQ